MKKANKVRLIKDVKFLTEIYPPRNHENLHSLKKVSDHIAAEMDKAGAVASYQSWMAGENEYTNVLCSYLPEKQKRLIIGAHYDVCGNTPGADDNASAVAGLLETIRLIFDSKPDLDFGIDFAAYCLEEPPYFGTKLMGSYIHAQSISHNRDNILGMICYEMIGYFSDVPGSQKFPDPRLAMIYPNTGNFIMAVGSDKYSAFNERVYKGMKKNPNIDVQIVNLPSEVGLSDMSDQRNYWKFGIPAMMINDTSFMRNPNYHQLTDTIDTLDFYKMSEVINCVKSAIKNMA